MPKSQVQPHSPTQAFKKRTNFRFILCWIFLITLSLFIFYQVSEIKTEMFLNDFVAFWSAGHLAAKGHNPYDPDKLLQVQKSIGWQKAFPERPWNPPWTLLLIIPFGLMKFSIAAKLWLIINFSIIFFSSDWFWRYYGGPKSYRWLAWIIGIFFFPTLYLLRIGQISGIVLLGIVGFLYFLKKDNHFLAGISILFIATKPHLLFLFELALILWVIEKRNYSLFLGMIVGLSLATLVAFSFDDQILIHYFNTLENAPSFLSQWATPTFSTLLRIFLGMDRDWLQFIPPILGLIWFFLYWVKFHRTRRWQEHTPLLLFVSSVTSIYMWGYDLVVLLVPVLQAIIWIFRLGKHWITFWAITSFLGIDFLPFILPISNAFCFIWMAPSLLLWYLIVRKHTR